MIRRIFLAAVLAIATGNASASAATATAFGDSFTAPSTTWYYKLALGDDNFAKSGAVCNSALTSLAGKSNCSTHPSAAYHIEFARLSAFGQKLTESSRNSKAAVILRS